MVMSWRPSTCNCKLYYTDNEKGNVDNNCFKVKPRCSLHKLLFNPEVIHKAVILHNHSFTKRYGSNPSLAQAKLIVRDMDIEKRTRGKL